MRLKKPAPAYQFRRECHRSLQNLTNFYSKAGNIQYHELESLRITNCSYPNADSSRLIDLQVT